MFSLTVAAGLILSAIGVLLVARAAFAWCRKRGAGIGRAALCSLAVPVAAILTVNAQEIASIHAYNAVCAAQAGRVIETAVKGVDGIRIEGDAGVPQVLDARAPYQYVEWTARNAKLRGNYAAAPACGPAACPIDAFSARYQLLVRSQQVTDRIRLLEQKAVDTHSGQVLGTERKFFLEPKEARGALDYLRMAWRLPLTLWYAPDAACSDLGKTPFAHAVLAPADLAGHTRLAQARHR